MRENLSRLSYELKTANDNVAALEATLRERDSTIAQLRSEIQIARRQRYDSNSHSKNLNDALERRNEENSRVSAIVIERGKKIADLEEANGRFAQSVIRWKSAFLTTLFVVAVPAVITASAAVYVLAHR